MNEYYSLFGLGGLLVLVVCVMLYPLRAERRVIGLLAPMVMIGLALAYWQWGGWTGWQQYQQQRQQQQRAAALLATMGSPQALITKLQRKVQQQPEQARGWYLLGRLYASQKAWPEAKAAFAKAHQLEPESEQMTVNYVQSLLECHHQQLPAAGRQLLQQLLQHNPQQPDALAMLAIDAYRHHAYGEAIADWQRLLDMVPAQSEAGFALRKAIAQAQMKLKKKSPCRHCDPERSEGEANQ